MVIRNSQGFNLIELIIIVGIISVVGAGITTMMTGLTKSFVGTASVLDFNSLVNATQGLLNNAANCKKAFNNTVLKLADLQSKPPVPQSLNAITLGSTTIVATNVRSANSVIVVTGLEFVSASPMSNNQYLVNLRMAASRASGSGVVGTHDFQIVMTLDSSNVIQGCSGISDALWRRGAGNSGSDIYYTAGNVGLGSASPNSILQVAGAIATTVSAKSGNYTLTEADSMITGDASGGAVILTLPPAAGIRGRQYTVKKIDSSANTLTLASTDKIDGSANLVLSSQYQVASVVSDDTTWHLVSSQGGGTRSNCPAGFNLIGAAGTAEAFCISSASESMDTWVNAASTCMTKTTPGHLCTASEWSTACVAGGFTPPKGPTNMLSSPKGEWVADLHFDYAQIMGVANPTGNPGCDGFSADIVSGPNSSGPYGFRCCFR